MKVWTWRPPGDEQGLKLGQKTCLDLEQAVAERKANLIGERSSFTWTDGRQAEGADVWLQTVSGRTTAQAVPLQFDGLHQSDRWLPVGQVGLADMMAEYADVDIALDLVT